MTEECEVYACVYVVCLLLMKEGGDMVGGNLVE